MRQTDRPKYNTDHFGLRLAFTDSFLTKICAKNEFYMFVLSDLAFWSFRL